MLCVLCSSYALWFCAIAVLIATWAISYFGTMQVAQLAIQSSETASEVSSEGCDSKADDMYHLNVRVIMDQPAAQVTTAGWLAKLKPILKCFCIVSNLKSLFSPPASGELLYMNGFRVISMVWIILSHIVGFAFMVVESALKLQKLLDNRVSQILLNGFYAVDTFFYLSGFLANHTRAKKMQNAKELALKDEDQHIRLPGEDDQIPTNLKKVDNGGFLKNLLKFYGNRLIRITPLYWIVILFFLYVFPYIGSGPNWIGEKMTQSCEKNWLYNFFYLNNFLHSTEQCLSWTWYLANDMQFFIISSPFLFLRNKSKKAFYSCISLMFTGSVFAAFILTYQNNLITGLGNIASKAENFEMFLGQFIAYFNLLYLKPHIRCTPYLIGIIHSDYLSTKKPEQAKLNTWILVTGWTLFIFTTTYLLFGLYGWDPPLIMASFHNSLSRPLFTLSVAWVLHVCYAGQGGIVNSILSSKVFVTLGRLTYAVYLIHSIIYTLYLYYLPYPVHVTALSVVFLAIAVTVSSYIVAIPVSLLFETPLVKLWRYYFP